MNDYYANILTTMPYHEYADTAEWLINRQCVRDSGLTVTAGMVIYEWAKKQYADWFDEYELDWSRYFMNASHSGYSDHEIGVGYGIDDVHHDLELTWHFDFSADDKSIATLFKMTFGGVSY